MFNKFFYIIATVLWCNAVLSMEESVFIDVVVRLNQKFQRADSKAYLQCYYEKSSADLGVALRSFLIKPKEGKFKDVTVGKIGTKYYFNEKRVEIGALDVDSPYQRCGYGEAALRTVLGIYRSSKNNRLNFDHFYLTVGKGEDRKAARNLYEKVGFTVQEDLEAIGYLNLHLSR